MALKDDNRPHSLIVGAGVAGCTLAYYLSRHARVTLLEAGTVGAQGASAVPVALLNPHRGRSARASDLDRAGLAAMWDLVGALEHKGYTPGVQRSGVLRIASNTRQARKWQKLEAVKWLEPAAMPTPYHAPFGGFVVEAGGWLRPRQLLDALVQAARKKDVMVLEQCRAVSITRTASGFSVETSKGTLQADKVVLCVGAVPFKGLEGLGLERVRGDVIGLNAPFELPYPIAGAVYGAKYGGNLYIGGNHRPHDEADPDAPAQLRRSASWFIKPLADAPLSSVWTGVRAKRADHQPVVKELEPGLWFYGALAGRGFLTSAYLSRQLAGRLLAGYGALRSTSR